MVNGNDLDKQLKTCAVLGGRGFIGRALVERLLRLGHWIVRVADSCKSPELKPSESLLADAFASRRATYFQVDVRDKSQIVEAINGVSVVFYTESMDSVSQEFYFCYKIIVQGAKNVVNACRECKVKRLIYNSCADVVFDHVHDIRDGDESLPYSGKFWDMVIDLRTQAEALILFANDIDGLLTCVLRPCNVYGPGDKQLLPLLVKMAKSHWDKFIIGSGDNLSDFTYVDNVAHAHICAEESLSSQMVSVSGKAFFITDLEPMKFQDFAFLLLEGLGYHRPVITVPAWAANRIISLILFLYAKADPNELDPCSYLYKLASRTRTFSCSAAQKHIQYSPIVPVEVAVKQTVGSFSNLAIDSPPLRRYKSIDTLSKIEMLLGQGQVAEILLWRDERKTFSCFILLGVLYHWFFLSESTFISAVANLLLLTVVLLCAHHTLPMTGFDTGIPRLPSSCFEISEVDARNTFFAMKCMWDKVENITKSLARGEDWSIFLKASISMYFFKLIVPHMKLAIGLALILAFTLCFVYEQYEEKIDTIAAVVYTIISKAIILGASKLKLPLRSDNPSIEKGSNQHSSLHRWQ